jgi:hypothetical protein
MADVPLPDVPCVRVRCIGEDPATNDWGIRFYLSYTGSAPSGANCTTLAGDVATAWAAHLNSLLSENALFNEVDVLDIATDSGFSGQSNPAAAGARAGTSLPAQVATNVEYGISRRYRGGKPRCYFPFGVDGDMLDVAHWGTSYISAVNSGVAAFFAALEALSVGSMGTLQHVNLSYYKGYTNVEIPGQRARTIPTYRSVALHDNITGYFCKGELSSQRRRRTATTP